MTQMLGTRWMGKSPPLVSLPPLGAYLGLGPRLLRALGIQYESPDGIARRQ